jgi:hypothetical protein
MDLQKAFNNEYEKNENAKEWKYLGISGAGVTTFLASINILDGMHKAFNIIPSSEEIIHKIPNEFLKYAIDTLHTSFTSSYALALGATLSSTAIYLGAKLREGKLKNIGNIKQGIDEFVLRSGMVMATCGIGMLGSALLIRNNEAFSEVTNILALDGATSVAVGGMLGLAGMLTAVLSKPDDSVESEISFK